MAQAHGQPTVAELRQHLADRTFVQCDPEAPLEFVAQIDSPPAHYPMTSRIGTRLDQRGQISLLFGRQLRLGTRGLAIVQAAQALGVVAMNPVPQGLAVHAAGLGRRLAIHPVKHHRNSQHSPRRRSVLLAAGRRTKLRCRQIKPCDRNRCPHRCRSSLKRGHRFRI